MNDLLWVMTVIQKSTYAYKKACDLELCDQEVIFQCTHISFWCPSLLDPMYHFVYQYYGTKVSRQAFYSTGRSTFWLGQKLKDLTTKLGWLHRDYVQSKKIGQYHHAHSCLLWDSMTILSAVSVLGCRTLQPSLLKQQDCLMGVELQFYKGKRILWMHGGDGCPLFNDFVIGTFYHNKNHF